MLLKCSFVGRGEGTVEGDDEATLSFLGSPTDGCPGLQSCASGLYVVAAGEEVIFGRQATAVMADCMH